MTDSTSCLLFDLPKETFELVLSHMNSMNHHCLRQTCSFLQQCIAPKPIDLSSPSNLPVTVALQQLKDLRRAHILCGKRDGEWVCRASPCHNSLVQILFIQAVKYGNTKDVNEILSMYPNLEMNENVLEAAVWYGDVPHLEHVIALDAEQRRRFWYYRREYITTLWNDEHLCIAIRWNREAMVQYLFNHVDLYQGRCCNFSHRGYAVRTQNESLMALVDTHIDPEHEFSFFLVEFFYEQLVATQNIDWILQMIDHYHLDEDIEEDDGYFIGYAAASGNIKLVHTLHDIGFKLSTDTMYLACQREHNNDMIAFLLSLQCPCDFTAYGELLKFNSFEKTANLLYQHHHAPDDESLFTRYLYESKCSCNASSMQYYFYSTDIGEAQYHWLVQHQCLISLNSESVSQALKYHSIPALQWLIDHHVVMNLTQEDINLLHRQPQLWAWYKQYCDPHASYWKMKMCCMWTKWVSHLKYGSFGLLSCVFYLLFAIFICLFLIMGMHIIGPSWDFLRSYTT